MSELTEKRRFARVPVNIKLILKRISSPYEGYNYDGINVDAIAINISPNGIAFKTRTELDSDATYMATISYKDYNPFIISMHIVNVTKESDYITYGCQFKGSNKNLLSNPLFMDIYSNLNED